MTTETDPSVQGTGLVSAGTPPADRDDWFTGERHVYEPHRVGMPPLRPYLRELWRRRPFAVELSLTHLRAQHFNTAFGQLWLVLNPILLAFVYFILVDIIRRGGRPPGYFEHLVAGIFAYYFVSGAVRESAKSVVGGGRLILNTAFPRALLPLSYVHTAFVRFLPTMAIYAVLHVATGRPVGLVDLWLIPIVAILTVLSSGLAMLVGAAQVYFRDLSSFLPYILRIWLYISPVLYYPDKVPHGYKFLLAANPLGPPLTAWSDVLSFGKTPGALAMGLGVAWAVFFLVVGAVFFLSREREFAVRL